MVQSRGGISGGPTIADALREFEGRGYIGQFIVRDDGAVECNACGGRHRPKDVSVEAMRRIEGVSDPADMLYIGALHCPDCGARGTAVMNYGPMAPASHGEVLRELVDERRSTGSMKRSPGDDHSLVRDSGWLPGPDG